MTLASMLPYMTKENLQLLLKILKKGRLFWVIWCAHYNYKSLDMKEARVSKSETDDGMMEAELGMKGFEDEESGLSQGVQGASRTWKRQEGEFFSEVSTRNTALPIP